MKVSELTWRDPVTIEVDETLMATAKSLAESGVGALIVVDKERPVGIVTDRDVVVRGVARGLESDARVDSIMSMGVVALDADDDVEQLFEVFARHAIRRVPIVDHHRVVAMVSLDDAVVATSDALADVAGVLSTQIAFPHARDEPAVPAIVSS